MAGNLMGHRAEVQYQCKHLVRTIEQLYDKATSAV